MNPAAVAAGYASVQRPVKTAKRPSAGIAAPTSGFIAIAVAEGAPIPGCEIAATSASSTSASVGNSVTALAVVAHKEEVMGGVGPQRRSHLACFHAQGNVLLLG